MTNPLSRSATAAVLVQTLAWAGASQAPWSQPIRTDPSDVGVCVTAVNRDGDGNVSKLLMPTYTSSNMGRVVSYVYTGDNLVEQVSSPSPTGVGTVSTSYQYDGDGKAVQVTTPTRTDVASYTPDELLASQTVANGTAFAHTTSYQYDRFSGSHEFQTLRSSD